MPLSLIPSSPAPVSPGTMYIAYLLASLLAIPGLIALVRALWFLETSTPALATLEPPTEVVTAPPTPPDAASAVSTPRPARQSISFQLADGRTQRARLWIARPAPTADHVPGSAAPQRLGIRYSTADPTDARPAVQSAQTILLSLALLAAAAGVVWAFTQLH